jgi:hypothetical protein
MASGTFVLPRHHRLDWQHLKALKIGLNKHQLLKTDKDT